MCPDILFFQALFFAFIEGRLGKHVIRKSIWVVSFHWRDRFLPGRFYLERQTIRFLMTKFVIARLIRGVA